VQPFTPTVPVVGVAIIGPQLSLAVAVPSAESMAKADGVHPNMRVVPVAVITGATVSTVQVTVRDTDTAALPQRSVAFHVLV